MPLPHLTKLTRVPSDHLILVHIHISPVVLKMSFYNWRVFISVQTPHSANDFLLSPLSPTCAAVLAAALVYFHSLFVSKGYFPTFN